MTALLLTLLSLGQVALPAARPVPRMQVIPLPAGQARIERYRLPHAVFGPAIVLGIELIEVPHAA